MGGDWESLQTTMQVWPRCWREGRTILARPLGVTEPKSLPEEVHIFGEWTCPSVPATLFTGGGATPEHSGQLLPQWEVWGAFHHHHSCQKNLQICLIPGEVLGIYLGWYWASTNIAFNILPSGSTYLLPVFHHLLNGHTIFLLFFLLFFFLFRVPFPDLPSKHNPQPERLQGDGVGLGQT